ncbi:MAG: dinitrogenase iron-molybdenum cofactor biosynthesis protein [Chitinivibrionales bacterium]|nr:dinitrogenase iron-molybdenum cofactor biosynthesis protein [Chitinivibrionales bacterium]MBD3394441.1 dinitrogenase iron-molybdenum cofactor biosynthesis protein [Chitinivibrionales bacterium]
MNVAVTSKGNTIDSEVDPRFGRCRWFCIVNTDDMTFQAVQNANASVGGGAGVQSGQLMATHDVACVLTGNCGPNAFSTLEAADIQVITGVSGTVREAVEQFKAQSLTPSSKANVARHYGTASKDNEQG